MSATTSVFKFSTEADESLKSDKTQATKGAVEAAVSCGLEYHPVQRTNPAALADILNLYPVMEILAPRLVREDLLSLSLVNKQIHEVLGQTSGKSYWKHLWQKCGFIRCEVSSRGRQRCSVDPQRCICCRIGMCSLNNCILPLIQESAHQRIRYVCRWCIIYGRDPRLSESPTLFGMHTLNQLTAGRSWTKETRNAYTAMDFSDLQEAQVNDWTFAPARADLFSIGRRFQTGPALGPPNLTEQQARQQSIVSWQTIRTSSTYDPKIDRVRAHDTSRCMCLQAGLSIPLCHDCSQIGFYNDFKYVDFARHNSGTCECGTMLVDFPGENEGEVIPGAIWDPSKDTLPELVPSSDNIPEEETKGRVYHEETIEGLCGWCGFRIYQQREKGRLPVNEYELQLLRQGMTTPVSTSVPAETGESAASGSEST